MGMFSDFGSSITDYNPYAWAARKGIQAIKGDEGFSTSPEDIEARKNQGINDERQRYMEQGKQQGRDLGNRVYGQDQAQTGTDVQDVIQRRRARLNDPSKAADAMRAKGQQESRYAKGKGASDLQQRNTSYQASRAAGLQEDMDYQKRLGDFQSLVGNIAATQSSLELGGTKLGLATQYIAPPKEDGGILSGIF